MRVRFLLVRLPFQQSMVLVMKELEGEQRVAIVPVVAPGETFHEEQAYRIFQEVAAGRLPAGAEELGEFEFPDEEAAQEAARDFVKNLKESLWGEVEAFGEKQQPSSVDTVLLLTVGVPLNRSCTLSEIWIWHGVACCLSALPIRGRW